MRVHHLNCISTCPLGAKLMDGETSGALRGHLACHCLLIEAGGELVLVDTGFGLRDVANPRSRLSRFFLRLLAPDLREEMTAIRSIERLGFDPRDVRHIVLTHLDFDHAGGLDDFPHATVHMLAEEREAALAQRTILDRMRYRPQQWVTTRDRWLAHPGSEGEAWFGFEAIRDLPGVPPEILMIPLIGHTHGHAGVAVRTPDGWLLHAGDAYFHRGEMDIHRPHCPPGLRMYQWLMQKDRRARLGNQDRLRALRRERGDQEVRIFSSHDPEEFRQLAGRPLHQPVTAVDALREAPRPQPSEHHTHHLH